MFVIEILYLNCQWLKFSFKKNTLITDWELSELFIKRKLFKIF